VNVANALTVLRLLMVPLFVWLLLSGDGTGWRVAAFCVFVLAGLTDVADGYIARRYDMVTEFGKFADPVADKALVGAALVGLSYLGELPWWATIVILGRELIVTGLRTWVIRHGVIPANRGGKYKALTQNIAIGLYLLPLTGTLAELRFPVLLLAVVLTVYTGVDYLFQALRLRSNGST
jgi:CDP-diacylglycerol--glycerol-3-phosphate 3-phosphatidyltransferase